MILGPDDPRALRRTGRTWERDGFSGPILIDGDGNEVEAFAGSIADITNGRLDAYLSRRGGPVDQLLAALGDDEETT